MATRSKDRSLFGGNSRYGDSKDVPNTGPSEQDLWNEVESIDKDLNELRSQYELYFMGIEKLEPQAQRDLLKARIRRFQESSHRHTALKFKMQQMKARMVSLENYWQRTLRQRGRTFRCSYRRPTRRTRRPRWRSPAPKRAFGRRPDGRQVAQALQNLRWRPKALR